MKLLIVGEASDALRLLARRLGACYEVLTAASAHDGLMVFRACQPDIVLLDLAIPDMDGSEYMRQCARIAFFSDGSRRLFAREQDAGLLKELEQALSRPVEERRPPEAPAETSASLFSRARALLT